MNIPLLYCNGCSYSDENYRPEMKNNVYVNYLQKHIGKGFVLNKAISGSNNRRILRTSLHDLYAQRKINPDQKIIALIQLTFELRGELWLESIDDNRLPEESNFITHEFSGKLDWRTRLLNFLDIETENKHIKQKHEEAFLKDYSRGRAYFYSPYQERINLLADLVMFTNVCNNLNVEYLIFQGPAAEQLESEYLVDFFKSLLPEDRVFDLENFGFCNWCAENNFQSFENFTSGIGHYQPDAHKQFAKSILIPHMEKIDIL